VAGGGVWEVGEGQVFTRSTLSQKNLHPDKGRSARFIFNVKGSVTSHFIFEGDYCHDRVKDKPMSLRGLHGYGAPLFIGYSRFHTSGKREVSPAVIDTGILDAFDGRNVTIRHPLYKKEGYRVFMVNPDATIEDLSFEIEGNLRCLRMKEHIQPDGWVALGLFFNGERKGSLWNARTFSHFVEGSVDFVASITTLFKLPFLYGEYRKHIRKCVLAHPLAFLERWTLSGGMEIKISNHTFISPNFITDESIHFSVCSMIGVHRLNLTAETCKEIVACFGGSETGTEDFALLIDDILDWSPRLASEIVHRMGAADKTRLPDLLLKGKGRDECIQTVSRETGARLIGRLLTRDGHADSLWAQNVGQLLHNRMFRRLLTHFFISNPRI